MGAKGSVRGKIDYPTYLRTVHHEFLDQGGVDIPNYSLVDTFNDMYDASPFDDEIAWNPDDRLVLMSEISLVVTTAIDEIPSFDEAMNLATEIVDSVLEPPTMFSYESSFHIDEQISRFEKSQSRILDDNILRLLAGKEDINSSVETSYEMGENILRSFCETNVSQFASNLRLESEMSRAINSTKISLNQNTVIARFNTDRNLFILDITKTILDEMIARCELKKYESLIFGDESAIHIKLKMEESKENLDIEERDSKWNLDIFGSVGVIIGGPTMKPFAYLKEPDQAIKSLSGVLQGAMIGAYIGSYFYGVGAVVGAIIGAIVGLGLSFL